ncbi:MAG: hypothetical protein ACYCSP_16550 [Acidobacteriaceae bacterium]
MADYFVNVLPPISMSGLLVQIGEPVNNIAGRSTFAMGCDKERGYEMYKHIRTRRYLNIDPATGATYRRVSENEWSKVPPVEAIRFARSLN